MPAWTLEQIRSTAAGKATLSPGHSRPVAKLEQRLDREAPRSDPPKARAAGRFLIRVESVRNRLVDCDGLCCKFIVDCCRFSGIIPDDTEDAAAIEIRQRRTLPGEQEHTVLDIFHLPEPGLDDYAI